MTEPLLSPQLNIVLADYRFCQYRLRILERDPFANQAGIAAILARMARLTAEFSPNR